MGIGIQAIHLMQLIRDAGYLLNKSSILELGSQQFAPDLPAAQAAIARLFPDLDAKVVDLPERFYWQLGFKDYQCIDLDGANNAHMFNLNLPLDKAYKFDKSFDVVTNHGTTEHAFNQEECFRNVHKMTKTNGLMIHALPSQGYQNHSFFNYHPSFFLDLAAANDYEMLGLFYNLDEKLLPYYDKCLWDRGISATENLAVFAVMKMRSDAEFVVPFDGRYYFDQQGQDFTPRSDVGSHYRVEYNSYPLSDQSGEWESGPSTADVKIVLPVWGERFTREFVKFGLKQQVESSLLDLGTDIRPDYIIVTDRAGRSAIERSPHFPALTKKVRVEFINNSDLATVPTYRRLTASYEMALSRARLGDRYIFTTSDCFFSEDVFRSILEKLESHQAVLSPALRVVQETFIADINLMEDSGLNAEEALKVAMRHEHPMTEAFCINSVRRAIHPLPAQTLYRLENGYVGRWHVMHPIAIRVNNQALEIEGTIDWKFPLYHARRWSDVAVMDRLDDGLILSLTAATYDQGERIRKNGARRSFLANMKTWVTIPWALNFHLQQIHHRVRLVSSSENTTAIEKGEQRVDDLVSRFMRYVNSRRVVPFSVDANDGSSSLIQPALDQYRPLKSSWRKVKRGLRSLLIRGYGRAVDRLR